VKYNMVVELLMI